MAAPFKIPGQTHPESQYTPEIFADICGRMERGQPLREGCDANGVTPSSVYRWCKSNPDLDARFMEARDIGFDAIAADAVDIVDGKIPPPEGVPVEAARDRARSEIRLKLLAKWSPRKYGERVQIADADGEKLQMAPVLADVLAMLRPAGSKAKADDFSDLV